MNITKIATAATLAAVLVLSGCSNGTTPSPAPATPTATSPAPTPAETGSPDDEQVDETPEAPATPQVDEYSQLIDGELYQGTEKAPVRIGEDTPGQAPAAEAGLERGTSMQYTEDANKYMVYVSPDGKGSFFWKVFGMSRHGSFRELDTQDYSWRTYTTREEAVAAPKTVDGRELDRAEYLLAVD